MSTTEILKEIDRLPLNEKLSLLERAIREIIKHNYEQHMSVAAESMVNEYNTNKDLIAFSSIELNGL